MADIIENLRSVSPDDYDECCGVMNRAADEIERLRAVLQAVMNDLEIVVECGGLNDGFLNDIVYTNARAALGGDK